MASINGIQVKNIKSFSDHEGFKIFKGDVYFCNNLLGKWSQDYMSGPDHYDFDVSILYSELDRYIGSKFVPIKYKGIYDLDCLIYDLVRLTNLEKSYKSIKRRGYDAIVRVTNERDSRSWVVSDTKEETISYVLSQYYQKNPESNPIVEVFSSIKDFKVEV